MLRGLNTIEIARYKSKIIGMAENLNMSPKTTEPARRRMMGKGSFPDSLSDHIGMVLTISPQEKTVQNSSTSGERIIGRRKLIGSYCRISAKEAITSAMAGVASPEKCALSLVEILNRAKRKAENKGMAKAMKASPLMSLVRFRTLLWYSVAALR